ncbi:MAG TPA: SOS response-associated peptidase [Nocardioides sp.]|nr:SOS response-associated peptidase [Nocardioides sp.]
MCGRYASSRRPEDLIDEFDIIESRVEFPIASSWNVAPTDETYVVMERGENAARTLAVARWGLVPSWAKDRSIASRLINARSETLGEKPAFRKAYASRRCLVPADGYYEWYVTQELKAGKPVKQPFYLTPSDGEVLPMAGLYEWWPDPAKGEDDPDRWLLSCTVITTAAADEIGVIHDRMPLVVQADDGRPGWTRHSRMRGSCCTRLWTSASRRTRSRRWSTTSATTVPS